MIRLREIVDVGRTVVSHARIIRETDQRYNRTRSRYAFVTSVADVSMRCRHGEQKRQVAFEHHQHQDPVQSVLFDEVRKKVKADHDR